MNGRISWGFAAAAVAALTAALGVGTAGSLAMPSTVKSCLYLPDKPILPAGVYTTSCFLPGLKVSMPATQAAFEVSSAALREEPDADFSVVIRQTEKMIGTQ